ncbi:hypothetical protein AB0B57_22405 [Micromonospora sp. NPDC049101]|uniref:hypothetical protein n=1 Tax=Micromonospora sp. NPDC049101 TaxID=3155032 RepID=UPI0033EC1E2E
MRRTLIAVTAAVAALSALACGAGSTAKTEAEQKAPAVAVTNLDGKPAASTSSAAAPASPAAPAKPAKPTIPTIEDGTWTVGADVPAGTYRTVEKVAGDALCYWAILKSGTNGADIIQNATPTGGLPRVTLKKGQDFQTARCGVWQKIG